MTEAIDQRAIVLAELRAHEVESRLNVAYWSKGDDVEYHIEVARKAFSDLATLLGYTVSRAETVVEDDLAQRIIGTLEDYRGLRPEDGETWESWYYAAFDMAKEKISILLSRAVTAEEVA